MNKGFSLAEIIIAVSIFGIFVALFFGFFETNRSAHENVTSSNKAVMLAKEGLEVSKFLGEVDYGNLSNGDTGLRIQGGTWDFHGSSETIDEFERIITISDADTDIKKIESNVTYDLFGDTKEVSLFTYLSDWQRELPSTFCDPQNDQIFLDTATADLDSGDTLLNEIYVQNVALDCDILIEEIRVGWSPTNPKVEFTEITIDGNVVWSGSEKKNTTVDIIDSILEPGDSFELTVEFDDDVSERSFTIVFHMSDNSNRSFNVTIPTI